MNTQAITPTHSRGSLRAGRILFALVAIFLAVDAALKAFATRIAVDGTVALGYPANTIQIIGFVQVFCLALLLIPRTTLIGALLWTGYLGGAVATHVRAGSSLADTLFPILVAAALWGALWLMDRRARVLAAA